METEAPACVLFGSLGKAIHSTSGARALFRVSPTKYIDVHVKNICKVLAKSYEYCQILNSENRRKVNTKAANPLQESGDLFLHDHR